MKQKETKIKWAWFKSLFPHKEGALLLGASMTPDRDNPRCIECGLCQTTYFPFVYPKIDGPLVFIKGQPDPDEAYAGVLGVGRVGKLIENHIIGPLNLKRYSFMTAVLCNPPKGNDGKPKKPTLRQAAMCRPFVGRMLSGIKGKKRIVAMGVEASSHLLQRNVKLADEIGEVERTPYGEVTVTYDPAIVLTPDLEEGGIKLGYLHMIQTHVRRFVNREPNHKFPPMKVL